MKLLKNDLKRLVHLCKYPFILSLCAMIATNIIQFFYDSIWSQGPTIALAKSNLLHSFSQNNLYLFSAGTWLAFAPVLLISYDFYYSFFGKGAYFTHTIPQKCRTLLFSKSFVGVSLLWVTVYLVYFVKVASYYLIFGLGAFQFNRDMDIVFSFFKFIYHCNLLATLLLVLLCTSISLGHWMGGGVIRSVFWFFAMASATYVLLIPYVFHKFYFFLPLCMSLCIFLFFVNNYVINKKLNVV